MPGGTIDFDDLFPEDDETEEESKPVETEPIRPEHSYAKGEKRVELPEPEQVPEKSPQELVAEAAERARRQAEGLPPEDISLPTGPVPHGPSPSMPGVKEVTYAAPMDLSAPDPTAKGPWIQYNGVATVRIITRHDWAQAGVPSEKYCEWNYLNGKRLPRSMFTDEELQYLLRVDGRFSLETT